jgi:S1-C subfamily serine protease
MVVLASAASAEPLVIDDAALVRGMSEELGKLAEDGKAVTGKELKEQLEKAPREVELALPADLAKPEGYAGLVKSVFMVASVYDCGKCDKWHPSGSATAWALTADGVMVSNHHVFMSGRGDAWGVCGVDGRVFRVTEILATDPDADVAVFRVAVGDETLVPLAMAADAAVGDRIRIVSHPDGRYFFQTVGEVARYVRVPAGKDVAERTWMSVTADYAKGSSGGPVVNDAGQVVGIVANTQSIYYGARGAAAAGGDKQGPLQMVVKNCVPVAKLRALIKAPAEAVSAR